MNDELVSFQYNDQQSSPQQCGDQLRRFESLLNGGDDVDLDKEEGDEKPFKESNGPMAKEQARDMKKLQLIISDKKKKKKEESKAREEESKGEANEEEDEENGGQESNIS